MWKPSPGGKPQTSPKQATKQDAFHVISGITARDAGLEETSTTTDVFRAFSRAVQTAISVDTRDDASASTEGVATSKASIVEKVLGKSASIDCSHSPLLKFTTIVDRLLG